MRRLLLLACLASVLTSHHPTPRTVAFEDGSQATITPAPGHGWTLTTERRP